MVYCSRCGTLNPDTSTTCSNCGAPLATAPTDWRGRYREEHRAYYRAPRGFGLLIGGLIIILIAFGLLYGVLWQYFWPMVLVIIGVWLITLFIIRNRRHTRQAPSP